MYRKDEGMKISKSKVAKNGVLVKLRPFSPILEEPKKKIEPFSQHYVYEE